MSYLYELRNVKHYHENKKALQIDYLNLEQNQIVGFFGPNGSGKSTLFSLLSFLNEPSSGEILYNSISSKNLSQEVKQDVVILPQNPYLLRRTVFDNVAFGLNLRKDCKNIEKRVYEAIQQVGLSKSFLNRKWSQLSGGEAQRVALASRLILKPKVLILDEPTSGVDTNSAQLIKEALFLAKQKWDTTLFISSHDHAWLNHVSDRKVALFQGELIQSSNVNLLYAPWQKDEEGNLVKEFFNGERLVFENSLKRKRDSIVMIDSKDILINEKKGIETTINSIQKQNSSDDILVEFMLGGVVLKSRLTKEEYFSKQLILGTKVDIFIDTKKAKWI